jgi:hypothetical protein
MYKVRTAFNCLVKGLLVATLLGVGFVPTAQAAEPVNTALMSLTSLGASTIDKLSTLATTAIDFVTGTPLWRAPERVVFSGQPSIKSQRAIDPAGDSKLIIFIDMSSVTATGVTSGTKYALWTQEILIRPLVAAHQIAMYFPFSQSANDPVTSMRAGIANFALNVDTTTGVITSSSGTIASR